MYSMYYRIIFFLLEGGEVNSEVSAEKRAEIQVVVESQIPLLMEFALQKSKLSLKSANSFSLVFLFYGLTLTL